MTELNTQIELIVSEIIGATRKAKTLEDLGQVNTNGINDITKLVKNLSLSGVSQQRELLLFRRWQEENWNNVYLYEDKFMVNTYLSEK